MINVSLNIKQNFTGIISARMFIKHDPQQMMNLLRAVFDVLTINRPLRDAVIK